MVSKRPRQNELLLLAAYVEPFASGRRVVVFGDDAAALGERLVELGARAVHAYVSGPSPEPRTAPGVVIKRLIAQDDLDVRDGSFDVAIVADAGTLSDPEAALLRARRLVGPAGVVFVGAPADGALGYYELFDLVSVHFAEIAMVGQVPFAGAALAVLGDDAEPEVTVDTQLAGDASPPTYFLAIASQSALEVRPYVILQLPAAELQGRSEEAKEEEEEEEEEEDEEDEAPTRRLRDLISERDLLTLRSLAAEREAASATAAAKAASELDRERQRQQQAERATVSEARLRAEALEAQLHDHRARLQALEQELARRDEQSRILVQSAQVAEQAADALRARLRDATENLVTRDEHLARVLARTVDLEQFALRAVELESVVARHRDLEASAVFAQQASMAAEVLEAELIELAQGHAAEIATLEEALRDRGRAIHALERELARRARMIQELLIELDQRGHAASQSAPNEQALASASASASASATGVAQEGAEVERLANDAARLRSALEALANDAARREGELQAVRWRVQELELQSASEAHAEVGAPSEDDPDADTRERLRDELEMLRQALRQEHDARLRAEAGEELIKARAEIQRQAVLLEQLRIERGGVEDASATG